MTELNAMELRARREALEALWGPFHAIGEPEERKAALEFLALGEINRPCERWAETPLLRALELGMGDWAKLLLMLGADPNLSDAQVTRPLAMAYSKCFELFEGLALSGADINARDASLESLVMSASATLKFNAQRFGALLALGPDLELKDLKGQTALSLACQQGREQNARMLIEAGAQVGAVDGYGRTPLMQAALAGSMGCALSLLGAGAQAAVRDRGGARAEDLALARHGEGSPIVGCLRSALERESLRAIAPSPQARIPATRI